MNTTEITNVYQAIANKHDGDTLTSQEWNNISTAVTTSHNKINSLVQDVANIETAYDTLNTEDIVKTCNEVKKRFNPILKISYCVAPGDLFDDAVIEQSPNHLIVIIQVNDADENYGNLQIGDQLTRNYIFNLIDTESGDVGCAYFGSTSSDIIWNVSDENKAEIKQEIENNMIDFFIIFVENGTFQNNGVVDDLEDLTNTYRLGSEKTALNIESIYTRTGTVLSDDLITLVNYFKTGAGKANGPWAD